MHRILARIPHPQPHNLSEPTRTIPAKRHEQTASQRALNAQTRRLGGSASRTAELDALAGAVPVPVTAGDAAYIASYGVGSCSAVRCELRRVQSVFGRGGGDAGLVVCYGVDIL